MFWLLGADTGLGFNPATDVTSGTNTLWLDPTDVATVTKNGSDEISQVDDKSGNDLHLTYSSGLSVSPAIHDADNAIEMPGVNCWNVSGAVGTASSDKYNFLHDGTGGTVIMVVKIDSSNAGGFAALFATAAYQTSGQDGVAAWYRDDGAFEEQLAVNTIKTAGTVSQNNYADHGLESDRYMILTIKTGADVGGADNDYQARIDNLLYDNAERSGLTYGTADSTRGFLLGSSGSSTVGDVSFKEILVYEGYLDDADLKSIHSYLNAKHNVYQPTVDTHILLGQSNAVGYALTANATAFADNDICPRGYINNPDTDTGWTLLKAGDRSYGNGVTAFGAETNFLFEHTTANPTEQHAVVKYAVASTSLADDWGDGDTVYNDAIVEVNEAIAEMQTQLGRSCNIASICWLQGETDATDNTDADNYGTNLTSLLTRLRADINGASATTDTLVIATYTDDAGTWPFVAEVNTGKTTVTGADSNAAYLDNTGFATVVSDDIHLNAATQETIGVEWSDCFETPVNTVAPVISGSTGIGEVLTATTGTWDAPIANYSYQWQRDTVDISGETGTTYTTTLADDGTSVRCVVTAATFTDSVTANSNALDIAVFSPSTIASNVLFLDPTDAAEITETNNVLSDWGDKSGNSNDATPVNDCVAYEWQFNGNDVMAFEPDSHFTLDSSINTTVLSEANSWTFCTVVSRRDSDDNRFILANGISGVDRMVIYWTGNTFTATMYDGTFYAKSKNDMSGVNQAYKIYVSWDGATNTMTLEVDGVDQTGTTSGPTRSDAFAKLGAWTNSTFDWNGEMGPVALYDEVLSAGDKADLNAWMDDWVGDRTSNLRVTASRSSFQHRTLNNSDNTQNAVVKHDNADGYDIVGVRLIYPNVEINAGEQDPANAITVSAAVDDGTTTTQVTFNGGDTTASVAAGSYIISDRVDITISAGATFYERVHVAWTGDLYTSRFLDNGQGDEREVGTGLSDKSVSGSITHADGDAYTACAIIAYSDDGRQPGTMILGDSITVGQGDGFGADGGQGYVERTFHAQGIPYANGGNASEQAVQTAAAGAMDIRAEIANAFCKNSYVQYTINDLRAARTVAQITGDLETIYGQLSDTTVFQATCTPDETGGVGTGTSADGDYDNADRVELNDDYRAVSLTGQDGFIEAAHASELTDDANRWDNDPSDFSTDGIHPNSVGAAGMATGIGSEVSTKLG